MSAVDDAIAGVNGSSAIRFRYEWRNPQNAILGDLTPAVIAADIALDNDQIIARTGRFVLDPARLPAGFDPALSYIAPFMEVLVPAAPVSPIAENANGDFSGGVTGWGTDGSATIAATSARYLSPGQSGLVTNTGGAGATFYVYNFTTLTGATAGRRYRMVAWVYAFAGGAVLTVTARFSGGASPTEDTSQAYPLKIGWQKVIVEATVVANDRTTMLFWFRRLGPGTLAGEQFGIDDAWVYRLPLVTSAPTWSRFQLGIFGLDVADRSYAGEAVTRWDCEGFDLMRVLVKKKADVPYTVAAGTRYVDAVTALVASLGLSVSLPITGDVTPVNFMWGPGTLYADIANQLLEAINWFPLWVDQQGVFRSTARVAPHQESSAVTYSTLAEPKMVLASGNTVGWKRLSNRAKLPNKVVVLQSDPYRTPGYGARQNDDPISRISTGAQGITQPEVVDNYRVLDLTMCGSIADYLIRDAACRAEPAELVTMIDPRRGNREFCTLALEALEDNTLWRIRAWAYELRAGAQMRLSLDKAIAITVTTVT